MKNTIKEFKDFIATGNLVDFAIAFVLGAAVKSVIDNFVDKIALQLVAAIVGKYSFNDITIPLWSGKSLGIGYLITAVINLLIVGAVLFTVVKAMNKMKKPVEGAAPAPTEIELLTEIRDSLKK